MNQAPKVIYILGHAYSGSTLFGLALGRHKDILCLGEVTYLESDYHINKKCCCGKTVINCSFWGRVIPSFTNSQKSSPSIEKWKFSGNAEVHPFDKRNDIRKVFAAIGLNPRKLYSKEVVRSYELKNHVFFNHISNCYAANKFILDLSKSPTRILAIDHTDKIDSYVIYLKRDLDAVFSSIMKRPIRRRKNLGFKTLRECLWLCLKQRSIERTFKNLATNKKITVHWDNFLKDPESEMNRIAHWLSISDLKCKSPRIIDTIEQHLYVGNRWLFKKKGSEIAINVADKSDKLTSVQSFVFKIITRLFNVSKQVKVGRS